VSTTPCHREAVLTPPLVARAPAYDGEYYTPSLRLAFGYALAATHKRAQAVSGPPQSLIRSLEVSGSQPDLLTPGTKGGPRSSLSDIRRVSLRERDVARAKTTEMEPHPVHVFPTAEHGEEIFFFKGY